MANLYTKTGDKGNTGLVGGSRVPKDSSRVHCYGTIDEANSMLGLAYSLTNNTNIKESIYNIQKKLFILGGELASDEKGLSILKNKISEKDVLSLEAIIDKCTETTGKQTEFVVPGVNSASAAMHAARTIIRRGERTIIHASKEVEIRDILIKYVNRLSDAIYALARLEETYIHRDELKQKVKIAVEKVLKKRGIFVPSPAFCEPLTLETAKKMSHYAELKAKEMNLAIVFSVVDAGGNLMLLHRMEDSLLISLSVSMNKAYTACAMKMPTNELADLVVPGAPFYGLQNLDAGKIVVFGGGFPYLIGGKVVGGIGVSGGNAEQDMLIAQFALRQVSGGEQG